MGVWARFAYALNAKTEYIAMFDDDTIPGPLWFENCLNTMKRHEGLLGTIGLVLDTPHSYRPKPRSGSGLQKVWHEVRSAVAYRFAPA